MKEKDKSANKTKLLIGVLSIIVILITVAFILYRFIPRKMPNLIGIEYYEAKEKYEYLDIRSLDKMDRDSIIMNQDIYPGEKIKYGEIVFVSSIYEDNQNVREQWTMPDFIGVDFNDAVAKYGNNILFEEEAEEYNEAQAGTIIAQDIEPGTEFKKGDTVKVTVSKGLEYITVPDLYDMDQEIAKEKMKECGLSNFEIKNTTSELPKAHIVKTEPEAGTKVRFSDAVTLFVSMGIPPEHKVRDYVGMNINDAVEYAKWDNMEPVLIASNEEGEENTVFFQSINSGESYEEGSKIILYYYSEKKDNNNKKIGTINYQLPLPTNANGDFSIRIDLEYYDNTTDTKTSDVFSVPEENSVLMSITGKGEKAYVFVTLINENNQEEALIGEYSFDFVDLVTKTEKEDIVSAFERVGGYNNG